MLKKINRYVSAFKMALLLACASSSLLVKAQVPVLNRGELIMLRNNSFIHINGSYKNTNKASAPAYISGDSTTKVFVTDSVLNNNDPVAPMDGLYIMRYMVMNKPEFVLTGGRPQVIGGTTPIIFFKLTVDKTADTVKLDQHITIDDTLNLVSGNILLDNDSIYLNNEDRLGTGTLAGENENNKVFDRKNGSGALYTYIDEPVGDNIAGMGISIDRTGTIGRTKISRGHGKQGGSGAADGGPGDGSILRFYQIQLDDISLEQNISVVKMTYFNNELDGLDPNSLAFYISQDDSTSMAPGSMWTKYDQATPGTNEFTANDPLIGYTRFTLAPFVCTNPPVIKFPSDTIHLCEGADTLLDPQVGKMTIAWSRSRDFSSVFDNSQTIRIEDQGAYFLSARDTKGCTSVDSIYVKIVKNPSAAIAITQATCLGDTVKMKSSSVANVPGDLKYKWDFGTSPVKNASGKDTAFVYAAPGDYMVSLIVTNQYSCKDTASDETTVSPVPQADFIADNICQGKTAVFTNTSILASSAGMKFEWSFGDGESSVDADPSHSYTQPSAYNVRLISIANGRGCRDTAEKTIQVYSSPAAAFTYAGDCMNQAVQFTNSSTYAPGGLTYQWTFGDGTASTQVNPAKTYDRSDLYEVSLIATTPEGCKDTAVTLQSNGMSGIFIRNCDIDCSLLTPVVNLGPDRQLCDGESVLLDAGNPGSTYKWSEGSSLQSITVNSEGKYNVRVWSPEGCLAFDEVNVSVVPRFSVDLGSDQVMCSVAGFTVVPQLSRAGSYSYSWGSDAGLTGSASELVITQAGTYWIQVNELSGCGFYDRDTLIVRSTTNGIKAEFLVASDLTLGDRVEFVQLSQPNPTTYTWSFGDGITSTEKQPVHKYLREGDYKVFLTVSNGVCSDTLSKTISVKLPVIRSGGSFVDTSSSEVEFVALTQPLVYPNPTEGAFVYKLDLEKEVTVEIQLYSLQGILVSSRKAKGKHIEERYDLTGEGAGLYLIRTILNDQTVVTKIIKL